jgi:hypothetical protein
VVQPAQRALPPVGLEDPLAELLLVEPLAHLAGDVAPPQLALRAVRHAARQRVRQRQARQPAVVRRDREVQAVRVVADHGDRPHRQVPARETS